MQLTATPLDFATGAAWHLQRGLDHYRRLEVERGSNFGNPDEVLELERQTAFELAWAVSDIDRARPAVAERDAYLGGLLVGARQVAQEAVDALRARRYAPTPPFALGEALRSANSAVRLLASS